MDHIQESIALLKQCPVCSVAYREDMMHVIEETGGHSLMHITCVSCAHGLVALMGNTAMGMGLVALVTDLSRKDVARFKNNIPLSEDELLEYYDMIHNAQLLTQQLIKFN